MTTKKNKEFIKVIGRRLRETPELSTKQPLSLDIERHLERLEYAEARSGTHAEQMTRVPMPAQLRRTD